MPGPLVLTPNPGAVASPTHEQAWKPCVRRTVAGGRDGSSVIGSRGGDRGDNHAGWAPGRWSRTALGALGGAGRRVAHVALPRLDQQGSGPGQPARVL